MQATMISAHAVDANAMVSAFCEAFADDPGLAWIWPDREDRIARLPDFFRAHRRKHYGAWNSAALRRL